MSMFDGLRELPELQWLYFQKFSSFDRLLRELPSLPQNGATILDLDRLREAMKDRLSIGELTHKLATKPARELFDLSLRNRLYLGDKNLLELSPDMETEFRKGIETLTGAIKEKLGLFQENYAALSRRSDFVSAAYPDLARAMEELKSGAPADWARFVQEIGGRPTAWADFVRKEYQAVSARILGGDLSVNTLSNFGQLAENSAEIAQHTKYPGFDKAAKQIPEALSTIQLLMGKLSRAPAAEFTEKVVPGVIAGLKRLSAGRITDATALVAGAVGLSAAYLNSGQRSDSDGWLSANWNRGLTPGNPVSV